MTLADDYINRVIANMPQATPLRAQIAQNCAASSPSGLSAAS